MKKNIKPTARKNDLVIQQTDSEVLVYDLNTNKASCLNETAAFVWQNCDGSNSIADIADALGRRTNDIVNDDMVWLAIDELSKNKLLDEEVSSNQVFDGMSRREVIKKVGLGTMVALPLVLTLVAPAAAQGLSCNAGTTCTCTINAMTAGAGNPCAPSNSAGCAGASCTCKAVDNGNNFNGTCSL